MPVTRPKRVAIVGGSCAGITSFWALQDSVHDVHLFEASNCLGGRIKALPFEQDECRVNVNTEPASFNSQASPNFHALVRHLGFSVSPTPLEFSASAGTDTLHWGCNIIKNVILNPGILSEYETGRMLFDIIRFKYFAVDILSEKPRFDHNLPRLKSLKKKRDHRSTLTVDEYLSNEGFSPSFRDKYLTPLVSALWRTDAAKFLSSFPIEPLVRSLYDHQLLCTAHSAPSWKQLDEGASRFIRVMTRDFPAANVHLGSRVTEVKNVDEKDRFTLITSDGRRRRFDHVVFAVDSRDARRILRRNIDVDEHDALRDLGTSTNLGVLHCDPTLIPNPTATYNHITPPTSPILTPPPPKTTPTPPPPPKQTCLTYNINTLQPLPTTIFNRIAITLNPYTPPHPSLVQAVWEYSTSPTLHPGTPHAVYSRLPAIQNRRGLSFCLGWTGRGFWEDAVTAGLGVAVGHLGAKVPFLVTGHLGDGQVVCGGDGDYDGDGDGDGGGCGGGCGGGSCGSGSRGRSGRSDACAVRLRFRDHLIRTVLRVVHVVVLLVEVVMLMGLSGVEWLLGDY